MFHSVSIRSLLLNFFIFAVFFSKQVFSAQYLGPDYDEGPGNNIGPILGISYLIFAIFIYNQKFIKNISKQHPVIATFLFIFVFPVIWVILIGKII